MGRHASAVRFGLRQEVDHVARQTGSSEHPLMLAVQDVIFVKTRKSGFGRGTSAATMAGGI